MSTHRPQSPSSDVDTRSFGYELEPVRLRAQWHVDALLQTLARSKAQLAQVQDDLARTQAQMRQLSEDTVSNQRAGLDPAAHRRALGYLAHLGQALESQRSACAQQQQACAALQARCASAQLKLEAIESHRDSALSDFATQARRRQAAERDREWLARDTCTFEGRPTEDVDTAVRGDRP